MVNLGTMYGNGLGIDADPVEAFAWWSLAAENGDAKAEVNRKSIEAKLSDEQKTAAKARASELSAKLAEALGE